MIINFKNVEYIYDGIIYKADYNFKTDHESIKGAVKYVKDVIKTKILNIGFEFPLKARIEMIILVPGFLKETVEIVFDDMKSVVGVVKGAEKYKIARVHELIDLMLQEQEIELDENVNFEIKKQIYNFKVGQRVEIPEFCQVVLEGLIEDLEETKINPETMILKEGRSIVEFIKNPEQYCQKEVIYYKDEEFVKDAKEGIWVSSVDPRRVIVYP